MHKLRICLLCNRASVSLVLCNKSIFVDSTFWLTFGLHNPTYLFACVFPCTTTCLVYLLHLQICESFPTFFKLTNNCIKFCAPSSTISFYLCRCENRQELVPIVLFHCPHLSELDSSSTSVKVHWYKFFSFYHSHFAWNDGYAEYFYQPTLHRARR